jgi:hypothetical protein
MLPHVQEAIHTEQSRFIKQDLSQLALGVCWGILKDENAPVRVRADVAIKILDRAGHVVPKAPEPIEKQGEKPMSEWSVEELEDFIRRGKEAMQMSDDVIVDGVCESVDTGETDQ